MNWLRRNLVSIRLDLNPLSKCLSRFSKRTDISSPDNPKKPIEERQKNLKYKMAKLIIIIIQFTVMISLMCCGKKEKEIIFRQLDPKYYEELERLKENQKRMEEELEETKKIKAKDGEMPQIDYDIIHERLKSDADSFRGPQGQQGIQGEQGAAGKDGKNGNTPTIENKVISTIVMDIIKNNPDLFRGQQETAGKKKILLPLPTRMPDPEN